MWVFLTLFDAMFASGYVGDMWCVGATEKYQAKPPTVSWKWKLLSSQDTTTLDLIIQYFHIPPFVPNKMKIQSLCARLQHHLQSDHRQLPLRHRVLLQPSPLLALCSLLSVPALDLITYCEWNGCTYQKNYQHSKGSSCYRPVQVRRAFRLKRQVEL